MLADKTPGMEQHLLEQLTELFREAGIEMLSNPISPNHSINLHFDPHERFFYGRFMTGASDPWKHYQRMQVLLEGLRQQEKNWRLITMLATDRGAPTHAIESKPIDSRYRIFYLFSCAWQSSEQAPFLLIEYPLIDHSQSTFADVSVNGLELLNALHKGEAYPSIAAYYRAAERFEREIRDVFHLIAYEVRGLYDEPQPGELVSVAKPGLLLFPDQYPPDLAPLRKDKSSQQMIAGIREYAKAPGEERSAPQPAKERIIVPVGPIHAGVIESGCFYLTIGRERIQDVEIQLGFKHRGVEKLFEETCRLVPSSTPDQHRDRNGWTLAENVSGDSAFAHSLAYCHAVETLLDIKAPKSVIMLRGLFLEMERMVNHIGDCAALARDVSQELLSSEISVLREYLLRLQYQLTGHRLLMGVNLPGGITLSQACIDEIARKGATKSIDAVIANISWKRWPLPFADTLPRWLTQPRFRSLQTLVDRFSKLGETLLSLANFQTRTEGIGILSREDAETYGATGLMARASGVMCDMRVTHPLGVYSEPWLQKIMSKPEGNARTTGDILSRVEARLDEVRKSYQIISAILNELPMGMDLLQQLQGQPLAESILSSANSGDFAWGYAEGWRGDIVYFVMKGKGNTIARCAVRDPSFLNWSAFPCVVRGAAFADFPLINKSCNLSYSGHDR